MQYYLGHVTTLLSDAPICLHVCYQVLGNDLILLFFFNPRLWGLVSKFDDYSGSLDGVDISNVVRT